jgi:hypothetical protein
MQLTGECSEKYVSSRSATRQELHLQIPLFSRRISLQEGKKEAAWPKLLTVIANTDEQAPPVAPGDGHNDRARVFRVGAVLPENVREFQQLLGVPSQPREFRENQTGDVAGSDVVEHPLSFWLTQDRLAAHRFQVGDLPDVSRLGFRAVAGALLMVLRALAFGLVFGGDTNPDADVFGLRGIFPRLISHAHRRLNASRGFA